MFAYLKCRRFAALYIEFSIELGLRPFFEIKTCNGETVFDIPYGQIIFTPAKSLRQESAKTIRNEQTQHKNTNFHAPPARTAKD